MEYSRIKYFLAVAETLNFTRAAGRLYVSQQSITKQVAFLEQELGVRLFERSTRSVRLTPAGEVCYREFSEIERSIAEAVKNVRQAAEDPCGDISVGFFSSFSPEKVIRPIMRHLRSFAPGVNFKVHLYDMFDLQSKFFGQELDLCITTTDEWKHWKDVSVIQIASEPFFIALSSSHPLSKRDKLTEEDLKSEVFFRLRRSETLSLSDARAGIPAKRIESVDNFETLRMRLELSLGFGVVTKVFDGAGDDRFVYFPVPGQESTSAEVVCAFDPRNPRAIVSNLARSLSSLKLSFD